MIKKLLQITLIATTLFSYEIEIGKSPSIEKKDLQPKVKISLERDDAKDLVIDKGTGLMWQDDIEAKTIRKNRKDAIQYCRNLVFAGFDDWYLPRLKELKTIVDEGRFNPAIRVGFKNIQSDHYWSSSPNLSDTINVLNIDFKSGKTYNNSRAGKCYVRCVRGNYDRLI
ncbi:MAG: DUF1566 domain-containing protein [Sulfurimonas sp.]|jgi:hypothetical protein|nr:DUF1566 domain-containing protein [Sulfurimonas sp.]